MLAHTSRGTGPHRVVLLHGFLGSGKNLASLARRWAERDPSLTLLLPDLTGHGGSPPLPAGADLATLAADVLALVGPAPERIGVVGHSLGGRVALVMRHLAPERIGEVTLLDIAPGPIPTAANELEAVLATLLAAPETAASREEMRAYFDSAGVGPRLGDWLLMNLVPAPGGLGWRIDRSALAAFNGRTRGVDLWPVVAAARTPTRCVRGGRSPFVPPEVATLLEDHGVEVATLPEAGHFVHIDSQDELLDLLTRA